MGMMLCPEFNFAHRPPDRKDLGCHFTIVACHLLDMGGLSSNRNDLGGLQYQGLFTFLSLLACGRLYLGYIILVILSLCTYSRPRSSLEGWLGYV